MKLNKRKNNGIWMVTLEDGRRVSTGERDKARAKDAAKAIIMRGGQRAGRMGSRLTLGAALQDAYDRIWSKQKSEKTARYRMLKLQEEYGHVALGDVTYGWLNAFVKTHQLHGLEASTINRKLSAIRVALREANKLGHIPAVPQFPFQKEQANKLRWLTWKEQTELVHACARLWPVDEAQFMVDMINLLAYSGARFSELIRCIETLSYDDLRMYFTETKNGTDRSIPCPTSVRHTMEEVGSYLELQQWSEVYQSVWIRFGRLVQHCGMPDVTLHTLRHTAASRLVQGGMDLYRVKEWLGHKDISTTQIYAHLAPESLNEGVAHVLPQAERPAQSLHSVQN